MVAMHCRTEPPRVVARVADVPPMPFHGCARAGAGRRIIRWRVGLR